MDFYFSNMHILPTKAKMPSSRITKRDASIGRMDASRQIGESEAYGVRDGCRSPAHQIPVRPD